MLEEKIKSLIMERYGSVRQFALKIDMPYTTIDSILKRGIDNSNVNNVIRMCKALNISVDKSIENNDIVSNIDTWQPPSNDGVVKIPILGRVPAGIPFEAIEDIIDYEEIPASWLSGGKEYFGLLVDGDSMEPEYRDKDVLIVLKQETCESGQDCIVMVNGDDATFKKIVKQGNNIILKPLNNKYDPIMFTEFDIITKPVRIIGVVREIRRTIKN